MPQRTVRLTVLNEAFDIRIRRCGSLIFPPLDPSFTNDSLSHARVRFIHQAGIQPYLQRMFDC